MAHCSRSPLDRLGLEIATLLGAGRLPRAPGTWGSVATLPLCWWVQQAGLVVHLAVLMVVVLSGLWATAVACRVYARRDPPQVVVDEAAGMLVTTLLAPAGWPWLLAGLAAFRLFDIWKPWPVSWLDRELSSPWGVMADDVAAGLYAGWVLLILARMILP
ncbi:MAG: phosphatidylglycerophosphatase A [Magnetococcus sp. DMHC-8]